MIRGFRACHCYRPCFLPLWVQLLPKKRQKDQCFLGKVLCHNNSHRKVEATFQLNICAVLFCVSNVAINKKWHSPASGQLLAFSRRLDSGECYEMESEMLLNVD